MKIECVPSFNKKGHIVIVCPNSSRFNRIYRLSDFIYLLRQDKTELAEALAKAESYKLALEKKAEV
jgi:hypothetical protein